MQILSRPLFSFLQECAWLSLLLDKNNCLRCLAGNQLQSTIVNVEAITTGFRGEINKGENHLATRRGIDGVVTSFTAPDQGLMTRFEWWKCVKGKQQNGSWATPGNCFLAQRIATCSISWMVQLKGKTRIPISLTTKSKMQKHHKATPCSPTDAVNRQVIYHVHGWMCLVYL